jgi:hypothetical protein
MTVMLHPKRRVNIHDPYRLTISGASPAGLANSSGQFLDGEHSGQPGSDYFGRVDWRNLVLPESRAKSIRKERTVKFVQRTVPITQPRTNDGHLFGRSLRVRVLNTQPKFSSGFSTKAPATWMAERAIHSQDAVGKVT